MRLRAGYLKIRPGLIGCRALFLLREHILKEQDGFFPAALAALDSDQWERIEGVRAQLLAASTVLASGDFDTYREHQSEERTVGGASGTHRQQA